MSARFADPDKTGYFVEDGRLHRFATYRGVRRVLPPSIALDPNQATIGRGQAKSYTWSKRPINELLALADAFNRSR